MFGKGQVPSSPSTDLNDMHRSIAYKKWVNRVLVLQVRPKPCQRGFRIDECNLVCDNADQYKDQLHDTLPEGPDISEILVKEVPRKMWKYVYRYSLCQSNEPFKSFDEWHNRCTTKSNRKLTARSISFVQPSQILPTNILMTQIPPTQLTGSCSMADKSMVQLLTDLRLCE